MGLLIKHPKASFWYPCARDAVQTTVRDHLALWGRERVTVDGREVLRDADRTKITAEYVTKLDGDRVAESEPVPVV